LAVKIWQVNYAAGKKTYKFGSNDEDNSQKAVGTENSSTKMTLKKGISQFLPMG
jgi:hypothetical protein